MTSRNVYLSFGIYLAIAACVVASVAALSAPASWLPALATAKIVVLGKQIALERIVTGMLAVLVPLAGALAAEYLLTRGRHSSLSRLTALHDRSAHVDLVCLALEVLPFLAPLLTGLFTFGLVALLNYEIRLHLPHEHTLFDWSRSHLGMAATTFLFFVSRSFTDYWSHRLFHTRWLWPIHRFHHSASTLSLMTAFRMHPTGGILSPVFNTIPMLIWGAPNEFLALFMAFHVYHETFVHSGAEIEWGWIGRWIQGAPVNHKVHHSRDVRHANKNFATDLPWWDRMFGTFRYESTVAGVGVTGEAEHYHDRSLPIVVLLDLRDLLANLGGGLLGRVSPSRRPAH